MAEGPNREFGKRRPPAIPTAQPVKRSGHVGLLLMGSLAIGGGAFALIPRGNGQPGAPGMAAPSLPQAGADCTTRGSTSSGGHSGGIWSRTSFYSGGSSAGSSPSGAASESGSGNVTRGGFGSFTHAFSAQFSGGG
jgi:hypothetical protein